MKNKELVIDSAFKNLIDRSSLVGDLLRKETDRGCALVAGAALDEVLAGLLTVYLLKDKEIIKAFLTMPMPPSQPFPRESGFAEALG